MTTARVDAVRATRWPARRRRLVVAGVLLGLLGGCTGTGDDPPPRPELVWLDGEPAGELESDEWVQAVREAEFARAWAHNVADFSLPAMTSTWDGFTIDSFVSRLRGDLLYGRARVHVGPRPITPMLVQVDDDGQRAMVAACVGGDEMDPPYDDGNTWPKVAYYLLELGADGNRRKTGGQHPEQPLILPDGAELSDEYCETVTIPRAVFDPPPDLDALQHKKRDDVIVPTHGPTP